MAGTTTRRPEPACLPRFAPVVRALHWTNAAVFLVLLATAAVLYVGPLSALVGRRELVRTVHVWTGLALPVPWLVALLGRWRTGLWCAVAVIGCMAAMFLIKLGFFTGQLRLPELAMARRGGRLHVEDHGSDLERSRVAVEHDRRPVDYKRAMVRELTRRALRRALERARGGEA